MEQWYVVHTKPRQEGVALENLGRQGFQCLFPRVRIWRNRRGRRVPLVEPLFPRYLFVQLDFGVTNLAPIRSTFGVSDLVRFGDRIPMVPFDLIEALRAQMDEAGVVEELAKGFAKGQKVRITQGPLEGLRGVFHAASGEQRALLLMELLGKRSRVTVPLVSLEKEV
ncbi:transcription/translation regulatory transformer protein RfaH [Endothiovibrio diazotrophicus]